MLGPGGGAAISALVPDARRAGAVKVEVEGRLMWTVAREVVEREGLREGQVVDEQLAERLEQGADEEAAVPSPVSGAAVLPEGSLAPPVDHAARLLLRVELAS